MFSHVYNILLDALFPLSAIEHEVLSMSPQEALKKLPVAPGYEGLVVKLLNAHSIFAYKDERVAKLVWSIKYKKSEQAIKIGGYALWHTLMTFGSKPPKNQPHSPTVVVPIPITKKRRQERGYNQCELLVNEIGRLDIDDSLHIEKNLLIRTQHTSRQTLKGREDRVESAQGIFAINEKIPSEYIQRLKLLPIVIIDDVITTGSTMHEAVETLKKAGFQDVRALSLAH